MLRTNFSFLCHFYGFWGICFHHFPSCDKLYFKCLTLIVNIYVIIYKNMFSYSVKLFSDRFRACTLKGHEIWSRSLSKYLANHDFASRIMISLTIKVPRILISLTVKAVLILISNAFKCRRLWYWSWKYFFMMLCSILELCIRPKSRFLSPNLNNN